MNHFIYLLEEYKHIKHKYIIKCMLLCSFPSVPRFSPSSLATLITHSRDKQDDESCVHDLMWYFIYLCYGIDISSVAIYHKIFVMKKREIFWSFESFLTKSSISSKLGAFFYILSRELNYCESLWSLVKFIIRHAMELLGALLIFTRTNSLAQAWVAIDRYSSKNE